MRDVPVRALRVTYVGELGWELYCPAEYGAGAVARSGRPASRTDRWPAATGRSTRCGSRRATASGARTSRPTTRLGGRPWLRGEDRQGRSSAATRSCGRARPAAQAALLHHARGPALGGARQRARAGGRRDRRAGHERGLRLHGRALDRVRVPAAGARGARHGGGARHLRQLGRRARSRPSRCSIRAASGYAAPREPARGRQRPYDEAYDEDGEPRPQYAELLAALDEPGRAWPRR